MQIPFPVCDGRFLLFRTVQNGQNERTPHRPNNADADQAHPDRHRTFQHRLDDRGHFQECNTMKTTVRTIRIGDELWNIIQQEVTMHLLARPNHNMDVSQWIRKACYEKHLHNIRSRRHAQARRTKRHAKPTVPEALIILDDALAAIQPTEDDLRDDSYTTPTARTQPPLVEGDI